MKKVINRVMFLIILCAAFMIKNPSAYAEIIAVDGNIVTIKTEAVCPLGEIKEDVSTVQAEALERAKRRAAEEAGTYIESHSETVNGVLMKDRIITISGRIMQVTYDFQYEAPNNKSFQIKCILTAKIDISKITPEDIVERDQFIQRDEERNRRIQELEAEAQRYKNLYEAAISDNQRQQIQNEFNENRRQFLITKYEKDIDIYDFNSNIDWQAIMETTQKLIEIDPKNPNAFRTQIYYYRDQSDFKTVIDKCKKVLQSSDNSTDLLIEACCQLGDIYYNEFDDKNTARKYIDYGIQIVKKTYTPAEIEKFVNGTNVYLSDQRLVGRTNSVRELYVLKSDIEDVNPSFDAETTVEQMIVVEDKIYNIKYRTDW